MVYIKKGLFCSIYGTSVGFKEFHLQKNEAIMNVPKENFVLFKKNV